MSEAHYDLEQGQRNRRIKTSSNHRLPQAAFEASEGQCLVHLHLEAKADAKARREREHAQRLLPRRFVRGS